MSTTVPGLQAAGFTHGFSEAGDGDRRAADLPQKVAVARQVHGVHVEEVHAPGRSVLEADALVAKNGLGAGIFTADCVPILLGDPRYGRVAAVHAGWRGTFANVLSAGVAALVSRGTVASELREAIGPAIGACCYEVSPDLLAKFVHAFGPLVSPRPGHLDLVAANQKQLALLGIPPSQIEAVKGCTGCAVSDGKPRYFSYRRDAERAGRQLSWIVSGHEPSARQGRESTPSALS